MASIFTSGVFEGFDSNGDPLAGGKLYTYAAGTTTPLASYTNQGGGTPNANPVVLDSAGRANVWLGSSAYRLLLKTSADVTVWDTDNVRTSAFDSAADFATLAASTGSSLVGHISAGTGAVATTVQAKLRESVSVFDFMTAAQKADVIAETLTIDVTAAFVAAFASTATHIFMPPGLYLITSTLVVTGEKTLSGPIGGTQASQAVTLHHDAGSSGSLFSITDTHSKGASLMHFSVTGGNGSFCITSSRAYVKYEYICMEPYTGGGIQLLSTGMGSYSSRIGNCQWVGPASATAYTGFEINVNGGDVILDSCTAIRGAIGANIIQGQTIVLDKCSFNKQTRNPNVTGGAMSSATQFNTAAIKLTGANYKQSISVRNCYIEACDNGVYAESCQSLSITDNRFQDNGAAGNGGAWSAVGNGAVTLTSSACHNVTIENNSFFAESNGTLADPFYLFHFNNADTVHLFNNYYVYTGDYSGIYNLTTAANVVEFGNTNVGGTGTVAANVDPSSLLKHVVVSRITPAWGNITAAATWTSSSGRYYKDELGFVHLSGFMYGGAIGSAMFTLPSGFRPAQTEAFTAYGDGGTFASFSITTAGVVTFRAGTSVTEVFLSGAVFSTT